MRKNFSSKPYTYARLHASAEYYLARYAASSASLRRVLLQRIQRHGAEAEDAAVWIEQIITDFTQRGVLNDAVYSEMMHRSLRRRGTSRRLLVQKLQQKGVALETITTTLAAEEDGTEEEAEIAAATAYLRRTRRGSFRVNASPETRQKDIAALMRQGFSGTVVRKVIEEDAILF